MLEPLSPVNHRASIRSVRNWLDGHRLESQCLEVREEVWRKENSPLVSEDCVRNHLGRGLWINVAEGKHILHSLLHCCLARSLFL